MKMIITEFFFLGIDGIEFSIYTLLYMIGKKIMEKMGKKLSYPSN